MRLPSMNRVFATAAAALLLFPLASIAQNVAGGTLERFKDTSMLKLPAGERAAIYEFEDLECPACAHAFPIVHLAVEKYHIPLIRHDFPLPMHVWSRDAAINARYLQDKVSPKTAEEYRRDVFAAQQMIASKDDLQAFTAKWYKAHGNLQQPFSTNLFAAEVQSDYTLGERIGLGHTPTIFVLAADGWTEVNDVTQLYSVLDRAMAQAPATAHNTMKRPRTTTQQ